MRGYITLDYELGLGSFTGTPEKCLVEPMSYLTAMTDKYGIKMNVFVDAAYLLRLISIKELFPRLKKDFETVTDHIKRLDAEGHSIQLHLHPQWCYSTFDGSKWILDNEHYKLSDMPLEEQKQLIKDGVAILNSITSRKVSAFRAGGYSLDNFSELYDVFISEGITKDTSVLRGEHIKGQYQTYDYRKVPSKTSYRVSCDIKDEDAGGKMTEYPISTIKTQSLVYLFNKKKSHYEFNDINLSRIKWGDGQGIGYSGNKSQIVLEKIKMLLGEKAIRASIDIGVDLEKVYSYARKHYDGDDFVIIGHPKAISPFTISVLERFIINHPEIKFTVF